MHVCERCGESNPVANRYCLKCGAELPDPTKTDTVAPGEPAATDIADEAVIDQFDTSALRFP